MRVRTFLRILRKERGFTITEVCEKTGLARGEVSMFERGHSIPRDDQAARMVGVYGDRGRWYPAGVVSVLMDDIRWCDGCGDELEPDASRRRRYHDAECRNEARRLSRQRERSSVGGAAVV